MKYAFGMKSLVEKLDKDGHNPTRIVMSLILEHGYTLPVAHRIVEATLRYQGNNNTLFYDPPKIRRKLPTIDTTSQKMELDLGDITASIIYEQIAPRIVLLENLLTPSECDRLCSQAEGILNPSMVMADSDPNGVFMPDVRSSDTAYFSPDHSPLVTAIESRIERLTRWPSTSGETLQIQRYRANQEFYPHQDFFWKDSLSYANTVKNGGQRLATLIIYLKQPSAGGATYFANMGARIMPKKGSAVFFGYPDPHANSGTLHGGEPVTDGEKWILTKWFRERQFTNN